MPGLKSSKMLRKCVHNCESGTEAAPGSHENVNHKSPSSGRNMEDNHGAGRRSPAPSGECEEDVGLLGNLVGTPGICA
ncbi:hypothetical protein Tsubulata_014557, partial [Turnera subulata]